MKQNLDEIWREFAEKEQEWYRNRLKILQKHAKELRKSKLGGIHKRLLRLIGPEWYQELSPKQLEIVDYFQFCIVKDLEEGTVINCQQNLIDLGVLPKCDRKHLNLALKKCNECPVEFLLILYQSINPKRGNYSLNDRLLLSAVVHLTMRQTLKELHVRIPSPPRRPPQTIRIVQKKKTKRLDYKSPYLVPFTFKPQPRKQGIYVNRHVQYPECPYFDYLVSFRDEYKTLTLSPADTEIEEELEKAQCFYEELVDFRPVTKLLKPTIYRYDTVIMDEVSGNDSVLVEIEEEEGEEQKEQEDEELEQEKEEPICDCLEKYLTKIKEYKNKIERLELIDRLETNKTKYVIGGIIDTPNGPQCLITGCISRRIPPDCNCMDLYNNYLNEHTNCMKIYEKYLEDMKHSLDEYTEEILQENEVVVDDECCRCHNSETFQTTSTKQFEENLIEEECAEEYVMNDSNVRGEEVQKATVFKRFFIYKNLPCKPRKQQSIIKAALNSMANDGFPLAKLPNSYKLPHFKLWMQMRCGKYWTQDDRRRYLQRNIPLWNHTDGCQRDIPMLKLRIGQKKAQKLTWQQADYCREIVDEAKNLYCKYLKEAIIDKGREFFPTTFLYEFPSNRFRDCYFAYVPTKEADLIGKYVWQETEIKDFSKRRICR